MSIIIRRVGIEQASEVLRIMRLAFEEYRDHLVPPSGALTETIDDVRNAISGGGAFLAFTGDTVVGSARYRLFPDYAYAERIAVLPGIVGGASLSPSWRRLKRLCVPSESLRRASASGPVFPRTSVSTKT